MSSNPNRNGCRILTGAAQSEKIGGVLVDGDEEIQKYKHRSESGLAMDRDLGVTVAIREDIPEWAVEVFSLLSLPGDLVVIVPVLAVLYLSSVSRTLLGRGESSPPTSMCDDRTAAVIAVVFGGLALVVFLESLLGFGRPPIELHAVSASKYGFPSGHTMAATILWGGIALWAPVGRARTRFVVAGAIVAVVGVSRLALGVHYLVDVVAGVVVGTGYLLLVWPRVETRPRYAFAVAVAIALAAVLETGGNDRSVLALVGTTGAAFGWQIIESNPVKTRLVATVYGLRRRFGDNGKAEVNSPTRRD